jgi:hypothetical protein
MEKLLYNYLNSTNKIINNYNVNRTDFKTFLSINKKFIETRKKNYLTGGVSLSTVASASTLLKKHTGDIQNVTKSVIELSESLKDVDTMKKESIQNVIKLATSAIEKMQTVIDLLINSIDYLDKMSGTEEDKKNLTEMGEQLKEVNKIFAQYIN